MPPSPPPATPWSVPRARQRWLIAGLAAVIVLTLLVNNAHYLFRAELFEQGDFASNSLAVLQAKKFRALYGNYSRWRFHHPGPAFFYCYAAGEALLYDWLKLVPTPFNAQAITGLCLTAGFFAAAAGTAARWMASRWFVPLTLLLGVLHFGAIANIPLGQCAFLLVWPPCMVIMPFLCLLAAAASVGAGRGEDLPLLALTCGLLVHSHVAQPLFVVPTFALAYAGLCWAHRRAGLRPPWRTTPRAHVFALGIAALFFLPIAIDLCRGKDSNFALIREHMRTHRSERHAWTDALAYFLDFGAYRPYRPGYYSLPDGTTSSAIAATLARHPEMTTLWTLALVVSAAGVLLRRRLFMRAGREDEATALAADTGRRRYLRSLGACVALNVALTLVWAHIQDGDMFFFNAFFNYSIYFALAMLAVGAAAGLLEGAVPVAGRRWGAVALCLLAAGAFLRHPDRFRADFFDTTLDRDIARNVRGAIRDDGLAPGEVRYLWFYPQAWGEVLAVALRLERDGYDFQVAADQAFLFGEAHTVEHAADALLARPGSAVWRVDKLAADPGTRQVPIDSAYGLDWWQPPVDPAAGSTLFFDGSHHPAAPVQGYEAKADAFRYVYEGFNPSDPASTFVFNDLTRAVMVFPVVPVADGASVELTADIFPLLFPGVQENRRLQLSFNGEPLGDWTIREDKPLRVQIPATLWNRRPKSAVLVWTFPGALPLTTLGISKDTRPLAFGCRKLGFALSPARP